MSPSFEDRIPLGLELEAAEHQVGFGDPAVLRGTLTQGSDAVPGAEIRLDADPYPFDDSWRAVDTTTSDEDGRFSFEPELEFNTAYRAVAGESGEALSDRRVVFVNPLVSVDAEPAGGSTRYVSTFRHSKERPLNGAMVFSYADAVAQAEVIGSIPFFAIEPVELVKPGRSRATVVVPGAPGNLAYDVCVSYAPSNAVGPPETECDRGRVPFEV